MQCICIVANGFSFDWQCLIELPPIPIALSLSPVLTDVVVSGNVVSSSAGDFSTKSAKVSFYYAYKHDGQLQRLGFDTLMVTNFNFDPMETDHIGSYMYIFFLVREGNAGLSLFCMSPLAEIWTTNMNRFTSVMRLLFYIRDVGSGTISMVIFACVIHALQTMTFLHFLMYYASITYCM